MKHFSVWIIVSQLFLFLLNLPHQLLGLLVLAGHDVADTQVGQHDGGHVEDRVKVLLDDGFIETGGFLELALLHEENVGNIQFPNVTLTAKLNRFSENFLHLQNNEVPLNNPSL